MHKPTIHIFPACLGIYSLLIFLFKKNLLTAFDWPATDMFAFFERSFDATFLKNDFFTNASMLLSLRQVFGNVIIFVSEIFQCNWYQTIFVLKVIFISALPVLIYYALLKLVRVNFSDNLDQKSDFIAQISILIFIFLILKNNILLSIAWWPSIIFFVAPQTLAFFLGFLGSLIYASNYKNNLRFSSIIAFALATAIHFTISISAIVFTAIFCCKDKKSSQDFLLILVGGFLLPALLIYSFFSEASNLSNQEFIDIYIGLHSHHYLVSKFANFKNYSWLYHFAIINIALLLGLLLGIKKNNRQLIIVSALSFFSYVGCVLVQYLAVVFAIKYLVMIGSSRYSMYGYWMLAGVSAISSQYLNLKIGQNFYKVFEKKVLAQVLFVTLTIVSIYTAVFFVDNPSESRANEMTKWIQDNSDENAVFATSETLSLDVTLVAKRAVLQGPGFPFNENSFEENYNRKNDLYGQEVAFDSLSREDFLNLAAKYDFQYLIIKTAAMDNDMKEINPVFQGNEYSIYMVSDLKKSQSGRGKNL